MTEEKNKTGIVILAAGSSSRLGQSKQLLKTGNEYLINRMIRFSLDSLADKVYLVLGADKKEILSVLNSDKTTIIVNNKWEQGIGSSIKAGLSSAINDNMVAVLFIVVDQIKLKTDTLNNLIEKFRSSNYPICASSYGNNYGIPAIFDKSLFQDILMLDDQNGCKSIIARNIENTLLIDFPGGEIDIDTADDLKKL